MILRVLDRAAGPLGLIVTRGLLPVCLLLVRSLGGHMPCSAAKRIGIDGFKAGGEIRVNSRTDILAADGSWVRAAA